MRWWIVLAVLGLALAAALVFGRPPERAIVRSSVVTRTTAPVDEGTRATVTRTARVLDCSGAAAVAARTNGRSADALAWSPFGRPEVGWRTYAPLIGAEIGTTCPAETPEFADRLAAWQGRHGLPADGVMSGAVFARLKAVWNSRRPLLGAMRSGGCPQPPPPERLETARVSEGYRGKSVRARPAVLDAYRRMVADARAADPAIAADPQALTIFSAFRDPASDAIRCLREGNCDGVRRARSCSPHRTGLALDLTVGAAPGYTVDSTADPNRLAQSRTPAYRWLAANARRYGFVNYPFEPWHWEWTGEAP